MENLIAEIFPITRKLYSRNICLRRLSIRDSEDYCQLILDNQGYLKKWMPPFPQRFSEKIVKGWIKEEHGLLRLGRRLDLGLFQIDSGKLIGRIALHSLSMGIMRSAGISYWVHKGFSGRGYTTEALATIVSFAFEECALHRLWLNVAIENKPSRAICQKLGFRCEGESLKALFIDNRWQTTSSFAMLEEEYDKLADEWIKKRILGA